MPTRAGRSRPAREASGRHRTEPRASGRVRGAATSSTRWAGQRRRGGGDGLSDEHLANASRGRLAAREAARRREIATRESAHNTVAGVRGKVLADAVRRDRRGRARSATTDAARGSGAAPPNCATCRRQAHVIDKLDEAMSMPKNHRLAGHQPGGDTGAPGGVSSGASSRCVWRRTGGARGRASRGRAVPRGEASASLLDLRARDLRAGVHRRASQRESAADGVLVRVTLARDSVCSQVEYSGRDVVVAPSPADVDRGGGSGARSRTGGQRAPGSGAGHRGPDAHVGAAAAHAAT